MNTLEKVKNIARSAGAILADEFNSISEYEAKGAHDIVTRADYASEALILQELQAAFPAYSIKTEESPDIDRNSNHCWIIDPIDGTSNFITGNPYFVVSIALTLENESIMGVVYNPINDELYHAEKGQGAWLNDERIKVSTRNQLNESLIAVAYAAETDKINEGIRVLENLVFRCRRVVLNFSPAYDLCNMARGRLDGLIDNGSTPEDHAAASLILTEAGGQLSNFDQTGWDMNRTGIIASNGKIHNEILAEAAVQ